MMPRRMHLAVEKYFVVYVDRIRTEGDGGAWCPKDQILKGGNEFLQIDLGALKVITLVETQGRFGNGQVNIYKRLTTNTMYARNLYLPQVNRAAFLISRFFYKIFAFNCKQLL